MHLGFICHDRWHRGDQTIEWYIKWFCDEEEARHHAYDHMDFFHDNNNVAHYIEPESKESDVYKVFDRAYYGTHKIGLDCLTETDTAIDIEASNSKISNRAVSNNINLFEDSKLRTFRLALSCTGEYANLFKKCIN